jgi:carboxypeptidase family protein
MISSTFKITGCVFVICLMVPAQSPAQKTQSGGSTITGRVTLKGNGLPGITVGARPQSSGRTIPPVIATTDQDGNYRLSNLPGGQYDVMTATPQFVPTDRNWMKRLIVGENETIENIDFTLIRGGVITGKVVDGDGKPVIEENIELSMLEPGNPDSYAHVVKAGGTDDRGVYRIFGLVPGKYRVSAGTPEARMQYGRGRGGTFFVQTFYPSVNEPSKATVIEVGEGSEVTNVDITLRRVQSGFTVTARVVDADTGQPIADARCGLEKFHENGSFAQSGMPTNRRGEVTLEHITPGKYALFIEPTPPRIVYAEPVRFEVVDQDVKDLVLKVSPGSSIAGTIVLEGMDEKVARAKMAEIMVFVHSMNEGEHMNGGSAPATVVSADGSFSVSGLRSGTLSFSVWAERKGLAGQYEVSRVERDGVVVPNLQIKAREQIKGVRLIVRARSGRIRGVVKVENGKLPNSRAYVSLKRIGEDNSEMGIQVDDRGRFVTDGLAAGLYEVRVIAYVDGPRPLQAKQQVVVNDNQVTEVTLTLDLKTGP